MEILCFYAGIAFAYVNKIYPIFFLCTAFYFRRKLNYIIWFFSAIFWGGLHEVWMFPTHMPNAPVIQSAELLGKVSSIPVVQGERVQFSFIAYRFQGRAVNTNIALACYNHCPELHPGQYWRLIAKLKKPRNLNNPGGFNYVGWLDTRHVHWLGTVRQGSFQAIPSKPQYLILLTLREHLLKKLERLDSDEETLGITQALALGATSHIDKTQWDLFRRTGTTHLIDISGAHIGLISGLTFTFVCFLWRRAGRLCLYWPAPKAASLIALVVASIYVAISGFAVPAQRAILACAFMLFRNFCSQRFTVWQAWRYGLLVVLIIEPHAVRMAGFYLSFIGVAILIMTNQRVTSIGMKKRFALQLACLVGMMPLTLFWFSYGAVNGLLANIFAIPWVELWIVPLALLVTVLPSSTFVHGMVYVLKASISVFLYYLHWVDSFAAVNLTFSFYQIASPLALVLGLSVCLFFPLRQFILPITIMSFSAIFPSQIKIKPNTARIDVMDVGQGLAVVVNTSHHVLIYDTGVKFFQGGDMAQMVLIPYLKMLGIKKIHKVVISHPDLDHRGGLKSLEESYVIDELIVDSPEYYHKGSSCHDYPKWEWDGVSFRFFAIKLNQNKKNNRSCVLQISTRSGQVMLTGDIEKPAEDYLVSTYGRELESSMMVIPHHGSKTSSSISLIEKISPKYAIASYGFDNRYHFPHHQAMKVYQQRHITILNTVDSGMITLVLDPTVNSRKPSIYIE